MLSVVYHSSLASKPLLDVTSRFGNIRNSTGKDIPRYSSRQNSEKTDLFRSKTEVLNGCFLIVLVQNSCEQKARLCPLRTWLLTQEQIGKS